MARSLAVRLTSADAEFAEIIAWYEEQLEQAYPPTDLEWEPVKVGPTWQYDNGWVLPEFTLGWRVLAWCGVWLRDKRGRPWQFTPEQTRFVLWFFAVDDTGDFLYHSAVLQRLKGWGKDPLAAALSVAAMFADVTFDRWDGAVPVGRDEPDAWVQIIAVSQEQTQNTMKLFPSLISPESRKRYGIQVGKLNVWGLGDTRQIQSVTNNPLSIEGKRPTLVIRNETQNWNSSNGGHEMAGAIEGNAAKSEDGAARMLDICNAYRPGEDSVGERAREAWDSTQGDDPEAMSYGLLYDSLEAPPEAPLTADAAPSVVAAIRGDAVWLSVKRIVASILNPTNSASESRRKWYNQITATADARFDPNQVKLAESKGEKLQPGDEVVLFGDGSKSDDATGLIAVRVGDLFGQVLHIQQPRKGKIVDRAALDLAVVAAVAEFKVVAFWFDPSHVKDEDAEGDERFWWPMCDEWAVRYGRRLKFWAVKTGDGRHAVAWDMIRPTHQAMFTAAVEQLDTDFQEGAVRFARSGWLRRHLLNARRHPGKYGVSMRKEHRDSAKKIDLAVCLAGGRMLARLVQLSRVGKRKGAPGQGRVVVMT